MASLERYSYDQLEVSLLRLGYQLLSILVSWWLPDIRVLRNVSDVAFPAILAEKWVSRHAHVGCTMRFSLCLRSPRSHSTTLTKPSSGLIVYDN